MLGRLGGLPTPSLSDWYSISKAQYEWQLKKWNARKNFSDTHWKFIDHWIQKRKLDKKESVVIFGGILIPKKKVIKETLRHRPSTLERIYASGNLHLFDPLIDGTLLLIYVS